MSGNCIIPLVTVSQTKPNQKKQNKTKTACYLFSYSPEGLCDVTGFPIYHWKAQKECAIYLLAPFNLLSVII